MFKLILKKKLTSEIPEIKFNCNLEIIKITMNLPDKDAMMAKLSKAKIDTIFNSN